MSATNDEGKNDPVAAAKRASALAEARRSLVERTAAGAPPSVRRRAIALAGVRIARSIEGTQRGKA
jgi:hypothetical protein